MGGLFDLLLSGSLLVAESVLRDWRSKIHGGAHRRCARNHLRRQPSVDFTVEFVFLDGSIELYFPRIIRVGLACVFGHDVGSVYPGVLDHRLSLYCFFSDTRLVGDQQCRSAGEDHVFPLHGWRSPNFSELSFLGKIKDQLHHAFLPILCYMVGSFATMTVLMKNSLMENLSQDYVRTAFAKGLSEKRVIFFHAVRNSLIPLATGIGGLIGVLLAGNYLIEKTFGIDGIGLLGLNALLDKDYNIIMGFLAISTSIRLIGNLISDLTYALIDPRIRFK